jgi:hypothetical protein
MTKRRVHAEPRRYWTNPERAMLAAQYPHMKTEVIARMLDRTTTTVYQQAQRMGLRKSEEFFATPASGRTNGRQGAGTRFVKGQVSWNKGRSYMPSGRVSEGWFPKGHMPHNWKPVGSTRINSEGYLDIKIDNTKKGATAWMAVHRLNWIAAHGPLPNGYFLRFKDGNPRNPLVENLELVTRADHLRLNWHDRVPKEVKQITQLRAQIARAINKRTRNGRADQSE